MALTELIYTSFTTAQSGVSHVDGILSAAEKNNVASAITGLLLFDGQRYIQMLEGETERVEKLFDIIRKDTRHDSVELLHKGGISERSFETWRMAYDAIPQGLLADLAEFMAVTSLVSDGVSAEAGQSFGARLNGMFIDAVGAE